MVEAREHFIKKRKKDKVGWSVGSLTPPHPRRPGVEFFSGSSCEAQLHISHLAPGASVWWSPPPPDAQAQDTHTNTGAQHGSPWKGCADSLDLRRTAAFDLPLLIFFKVFHKFLTPE